MEKLKNLSEVACPRHPSFPIQAVHMEETEEKQFLCTQCFLELKDFSVMSKIKSIAELIATVSKTYLEKKNSWKSSQKPVEFMDLLSGKAEIIETLNRHVEEEKKKTEIFFNLMLEQVTNIIVEKKDQYLKELNEQVSKLDSRFAHFERQLKKAYPPEEDLGSLFPSQEVLEKRFQSLSDFSKFKDFIGTLKEDLQETEFIAANQGKKESQDLLKQLYENILKLRENKPCYLQNDQILLELNNKLKQDILEFLDKKVILENPIEEFLGSRKQANNGALSEEIPKIKKWLPKRTPFNPKLIYSSTRDGNDTISFHKLCDGKNNTITLCEVIFDGSDKPCILGGFLDVPWNSKNEWIYSSSAFIFSITGDIQCPLKADRHSYAAYGHIGNGPTFGECDLYTPINSKGWVNPSYYDGTEELIQSDSYDGDGKIYFQTLEVQVYSLD